MRLALIASIFALLIVPAPASAQPARQLILFSGPGYAGARFTVTGDRPRLAVPFEVKSIWLRRGEQWEVCAKAGYGNCRVLRGPEDGLKLAVRSVRPIRAGGQGGAGPRLRGTTSEYFAVPAAGGERVRVAPANAEGASRAADEFCRRIGWAGSAYERLQATSGRVYLIDVLCVRRAE